MMSNNSFWHKIFNSSLFLVILITTVGLIIYSIIKEKNQQAVINENIKSLEDEIANLSSRNLELSQMIKYFRSDEYVEHEAREKLNMLKPGEKVIIVPADLKNQGQVIQEENKRIKKNWERWVDYFFAFDD